MGNNASNVSAGKPNIAGAIWCAPKGTTLPTDTSTTLDAAFKCLGYVSEDGTTNSTGLESEKIKAWGGDTVLVIQKSKDDSFKYTLLEVLNEDVLKYVYGSDNVSGDLATGIAIAVNNKDVEEHAIVIDMILRDNTAKRIVIPDGKISEVEDIVYSDSAAVGYGTTLECIPDASGNTHYEYLKKGE
jgi:hypothetical protein